MTRWYALATLAVVYLFNFLDRTLIFILFPKIKAEMTFTDLQLALLGSTSFVLFYTALGVPFGRLADRVSRTRLIAVGLLIWSVFSGLTGFAQGFWGIFFCRVMVGVGEATLGPAAMSLLSDWFEPRRRATVQSLFTLGIPLGAAAAFFLGSAAGEAWGWRAAFWALGFPGVLLAGLMLLFAEPARTGVPSAARTTPLGEDLRRLAGIPALRWHLLGYALLATASNALAMWVPTLLVTARGWSLADAGLLLGGAMALGGGLATASGGWVADRFRARHPGGRFAFTALTAVLAAAAWVVLLSSNNMGWNVAGFFALAGLGLAWLGPAAADVHELVDPRQRGLGVAVYYLVVNLVGYGAAPPLIGVLSDAAGAGDDPGRLAWALVVCPVAAALGALALWRARGLMGARRAAGMAVAA